MSPFIRVSVPRNLLMFGPEKTGSLPSRTLRSADGSLELPMDENGRQVEVPGMDERRADVPATYG
jgi:hypothetical protein